MIENSIVVSTVPERRVVTISDGRATIVARLDKGYANATVKIEEGDGVISLTHEEIQKWADEIFDQLRELNDPDNY